MKSPLSLICLLGLTSGVGAQTPPCPVTIYEALKDPRLHPLQRSRIAELAPFPFATLVADSDLIIEGNAQRLGTYVSKDGCYLYTDSAVAPRSVIVGRVRVPKEPGPPVVVRQWGGELVIDGTQVTFRDGNLRLLDNGEHVVLFLTGPDKEGVYEIVGDFVGAFGVVNGIARALTPDADAVHGEFRQMPLGKFVAEIHRLRGR